MIAELCVILLLLQLADGVTTYVAIKRGATEANPVLKWARNNIPGKWTWLLLAKALGVATILWLASAPFEYQTESLVALTLLYVGIVGNNVKVIRGLR